MKFHPDRGGFTEILTGMQPQIDGLARAVAADVSAQLPSDGTGDVIAESYDFKPRGRTSDRAAASVAIRRPDAKLRQARDGILTRAAARQGLEVRAKADG